MARRTLQEITNEAARREQRKAQRQNLDQQQQLSGLRRQIGNLLRDTQRQAHVSQSFSTKQKEAVLDLEQLEQSHPEFTDLTIERMVLYGVLFVALPIIYLIDLMLFFQTALVLSDYAFTYRSWMVTVFCYLIPALVLGIELGVASQMYAARQPQSGAGTNNLSYGKWFVLGLMLLIVMPTLVISTHPALEFWGQGDHLSKLLTWQLVGFVALVIVTHCFVIFGGDLAHNAKAYALFSGRRLALRQTIRRCEARHQQAAQTAVESFGTYLRMLDEYRRLDSNVPMAAGPFDSVTRNLINQLHGYEVIKVSDADANDNVHLERSSTKANENGNGRPLPPLAESSDGAMPNGNRPVPAAPSDSSSTLPEAVERSSASLSRCIPSQPIVGINADDAEPDGTEEYLRTLLTRQIRNAEGEVR